LVENVEKPHNLSAIIRSCDAVGVLEAYAIFNKEKFLTFNSTAQGSQKWVQINQYKETTEAIKILKNKGFKLYGTNLSPKSIDYRECNFTQSTAFVLGAEKWGISEEASSLMDEHIHIPMRGMVESLNVSVAASALLFEALRQRKVANLIPESGEGMSKETYKTKLFEWAYPEVANWCKSEGKEYPSLNEKGEIIDELPRTERMRY
jgi:tRNA (guanosine-2'-O-)-methyltransferase